MNTAATQIIYRDFLLEKGNTGATLSEEEIAELMRYAIDLLDFIGEETKKSIQAVESI